MLSQNRSVPGSLFLLGSWSFQEECKSIYCKSGQISSQWVVKEYTPHEKINMETPKTTPYLKPETTFYPRPIIVSKHLVDCGRVTATDIKIESLPHKKPGRPNQKGWAHERQRCDEDIPGNEATIRFGTWTEPKTRTVPSLKLTASLPLKTNDWKMNCCPLF